MSRFSSMCLPLQLELGDGDLGDAAVGEEEDAGPQGSIATHLRRPSPPPPWIWRARELALETDARRSCAPATAARTSGEQSSAAPLPLSAPASAPRRCRSPLAAAAVG